MSECIHDQFYYGTPCMVCERDRLRFDSKFWQVVKKHMRSRLDDAGQHLILVECPTVFVISNYNGEPIVKCEACGKILQWVYA